MFFHFRCYSDTGLSSTDIDVLEVHDCFSCNELFMYEAMGLADEGKALELFRNGKWVTNKNGGKVHKMANKWVVNASGGLESKGHPIGATGTFRAYSHTVSVCVKIATSHYATPNIKGRNGHANTIAHCE